LNQQRRFTVNQSLRNNLCQVALPKPERLQTMIFNMGIID